MLGTFVHIFNFLAVLFIIGQAISFVAMLCVVATERECIAPRWLATTALTFGQLWLFALIVWNRDENKSFWKWYYRETTDQHIISLFSRSLMNLIFVSVFTVILSIILTIVATIIPLFVLILAKLMPLILVAMSCLVGYFIYVVVRDNKRRREDNYAYFRRRVASLVEANKALKQEVEVLNLRLQATK